MSFLELNRTLVPLLRASPGYPAQAFRALAKSTRSTVRLAILPSPRFTSLKYLLPFICSRSKNAASFTTNGDAKAISSALMGFCRFRATLISFTSRVESASDSAACAECGICMMRSSTLAFFDCLIFSSSFAASSASPLFLHSFKSYSIS